MDSTHDILFPPHARAAGYYSRLAESLDAAYGPAETERALVAAGKALARLRAYYLEYAAPYPYDCAATQVAYGAAYIPHYAMQFALAFRRHGLGGYDRTRSTSMVCLGGGPGTEALGLSYALLGAKGQTRVAPLRFTLVDHPANPWAIGRGLVRREISWQQRHSGLGPVYIGALGWDFLSEGAMPAAVQEAVAAADVVSVSNVLTEVLRHGQPAALRFRDAVEQVFRVMRPGADLLFVDLANCHGVEGELAQLASRLREAGGEVGAPMPARLDSPLRFVDSPRIQETIFSQDSSSNRLARRWVHSISLHARKT